MQICEHEIPSGSKLYFGKSAKLKRKIEQSASEILEQNGFNEIITPFFSYHQSMSVKPSKLLRLSDEKNDELALRSDSTIDVVRIITRRLKEQEIKKWFYIQPVFFYPSSEVYQIGAEILDSNELEICAKMSSELLKSFKVDTVLQISNMQIPYLLCELLDLKMSVFEEGRLELLLGLNISWLSALAKASTKSDIENLLDFVPKELKKALQDMLDLGANFSCDLGEQNIAFAPVYYSKMRYYDRLFFRFIKDNYILASGGLYQIDERNCAGFAVHCDNVIEILQEL